MRTSIRIALAIGVLSLATLAPFSAMAQRHAGSKSSIKHREKTRDEWKNIAIGSGLVGVLGLLKNDGTLTFVGTAGALYSAYRYEEDRKSADKLKRARAAYFSRPSFYRNGKKYVRRTVYKGGKKYYQFVCMKR